jgi:hypothetical protein
MVKCGNHERPELGSLIILSHFTEKNSKNSVTIRKPLVHLFLFICKSWKTCLFCAKSTRWIENNAEKTVERFEGLCYNAIRKSLPWGQCVLGAEIPDKGV